MEISEETKRSLTAVNQALKADQERLLAEERIRQIVREELEAWEKRQAQVRRFGLPVNSETK